MTLRVELNALAPRLRRYARALQAGDPRANEEADDLVKRIITDALARTYPETGRELLIRLLTKITILAREVSESGTTEALQGYALSRPLPSSPVLTALNSATRSGTKIAGALMSLPTEQREALLLVTLERCDYGEAARILRIARSTLMHRLTEARSALDAALQARVAPPRAQPRSVPYLRVVS